MIPSLRIEKTISFKKDCKKLKRFKITLFFTILETFYDRVRQSKKIDFGILVFFRIPHTKISLLLNFYINLIIFRYFFIGSNMCHNTYINIPTK